MRQREIKTAQRKGKGSSSAHHVPKNWPPEILYIRGPVYSNRLTSSELSYLHPASSPKQAASITPSTALVKICPIASPPTHPALHQHGLFATRHLPPGSLILDYLGLYHSQPSASDYDLSLSRDLGIGIDAVAMGNEGRFINDYRGIRNGPNAEFRERIVGSERRMGVWVLPVGKSGKGKGIGKGEEICVSYGKGFWKGRESEREVDGIYEDVGL
ncbi:hypothetical protein FGG08_000736 [Glutinoglossum americanum]|uniref:SET domain-containing protein n=1 Tax=Glutinoglossum americanum TaxID=1670608 RepID=A0A9P8I8D3_9PEZI|nr:hypothetical protein FGG08_000736 [Glutinoglossum americanum]